MISVPEITNIMREPGISELVVAADMMTAELATLNPEDDLYVALAGMARNKDPVVPVGGPEDGSRFLGMLTHGDMHRNVRTQLNDLRKHLVREHQPLAGMEHEEALVMGVPSSESTKVQRLLVPVQATGKSLRETDSRRQCGVQVIGIEQSDGSIQCPPDVDTPLKTDQRLIGIVALNAS